MEEKILSLLQVFYVSDDCGGSACSCGQKPR